MNFRDLVKNSKVMIGTGIFFLLLGLLALVVSRTVPVPYDDRFTGFLYGVSIGCLLVGLKQKMVRGR